jgi:uncharacterized protein (DUF1778 family)
MPKLSLIDIIDSRRIAGLIHGSRSELIVLAALRAAVKALEHARPVFHSEDSFAEIERILKGDDDGTEKTADTG